MHLLAVALAQAISLVKFLSFTFFCTVSCFCQTNTLSYYIHLYARFIFNVTACLLCKCVIMLKCLLCNMIIVVSQPYRTSPIKYIIQFINAQRNYTHFFLGMHTFLCTAPWPSWPLTQANMSWMKVLKECYTEVHVHAYMLTCDWCCGCFFLFI